jgi:hypothetical protein
MLIDTLWRLAGALSGGLESLTAAGWSVTMRVPRPQHRRRT